MGAPCTSNATSWVFAANVGDIYTAAGLNEMHSATNDEEIRRGIAQVSFTNRSAGYLATAADLTQLKNAINNCK